MFEKANMQWSITGSGIGCIGGDLCGPIEAAAPAAGHPMTSRGLLFAVLISASCSSSPLGVCAGPQDCGGNPCCWRVVNVRDLGTSCEATASGCVPELGVDTLSTRLCETDSDCTSGGITTALKRCCQESGHAFKGCASACLSP